MQSLCHEYNINNEFTGFINQTEIPIWYSKSDIGVIISDYDPSPKTGNEMLNFGIALILSKQIGTANNIISGNGIILKNNHDHLELRDSIDYMLSNKKILSEMKERSKEISGWYKLSRNSEVLKEICHGIK